MATWWLAVTAAGCSVAVSSRPDEGTGNRTVAVGAELGGEGAASAQELDRTAVPEVGAPPAVDLPTPVEYTLDNGLRVVLVERRALPLVSMQMLFPGGASAHGVEQAGLAALVADMLDEGTETRTALEVADDVDLLGATLTSTASYDDATVSMTVLRPHLDRAMELLADVVIHPTFPEEDLQRVLRQRTARILQRRDQPNALAADAFGRVVFGDDDPYGAPLIGTEASMAALTRDDLVAFHRARYAPGGASLVVVGDVDREELDPILDRALRPWRGELEAIPALPTPPAVARRTIYLVDRPGSAQSVVRMGRVAVARSTTDYYPLQVLNTVLGGSFTSRLNQKLREEKGYTYGAGSRFDMRVAPGPFVASAAVATAVTDSSVVEFLREIQGMASRPVPEDELARARNYLALRLPQRFETVDDVVRRLSELVLHDLPLDSWDGYVDGVSAVDAGTVQAMARRYLDTDEMIVVIAGDRSVIQEPLERLGLGPVVVLGDSPASGGGP